MKKIHIILGIIIAFGVILGAVYRFDTCKASRDYVTELAKLKADRKEVMDLAGNFEIYKLEQYRRYLQERIWAMQTMYPTQYSTMPEYLRLVQEMRQIDLKINAYYKRGGK